MTSKRGGFVMFSLVRSRRDVVVMWLCLPLPSLSSNRVIL